EMCIRDRFYGMPATIALSSMLLLTVVSFKQRALWGWLGLIFVVVLAMSGWLKWQVETVEKWLSPINISEPTRRCVQ
ncbi:hypothetical protein V3C21_24765, partial [Salmonella enterica subsp. enterica serovar Paratyphi B]